MLTVQYNNNVTDEMEVDVAFRPTTPPKENKPVMQLFTLRFLDRLVTESQVEEFNLKQGNEFMCVHKVLRQPQDGCYTEDWIIPQVGKLDYVLENSTAKAK